MTRASDLTLLDIADKLLDTGVSLTGEATISVADVDLIYLGLDVVLASAERIRGQGTVPLVPFPKWPAPLPHGPGAMSAATYPSVDARLPKRIDVDPDEVDKGLAKLVLTIVEFIRQLLERQAVRRMDGGGLTAAQIERVGVALMRLEEKVAEMAARFGLKREELRLGLGPLGELL
jgi:hypothetical protein